MKLFKPKEEYKCMASKEIREKMKQEVEEELINENEPITLEYLAREMKYQTALTEKLYAITVNGYSTTDASRGFRMAIEVGRVWDTARKTWPLLLLGFIGFAAIMSALSVNLSKALNWALDKIF